MPPLRPFSFERIAQAVEAVRERLRRSTAALDAAGVPHAVIGGNAVMLHVERHGEGGERNTPNVDLLVRPLDLSAAGAALEAAGFVYRGTPHHGVFLDGEEGFERSRVLLVPAGQRQRAADVEPTADVSQSEQIGGFRVVLLLPLLRMKLVTGRRIDRVHVRDLIDCGLVDRSWPDRLPLALRPRLQELLDDPDG